jgi:hypothetical protein
MGHYCTTEITGPEVIMTTILKLMGHRAYGMRGDSVLASLHHLFVFQCRLMSGAWTHLSVPGYAKRAVWARNAAPDGLPLAGEEK